MADLFARERFNAVMRQPFSEHQNVDHPLSLYATTKKANELMAHSSMPILYITAFQPGIDSRHPQ